MIKISYRESPNKDGGQFSVVKIFVIILLLCSICVKTIHDLVQKTRQYKPILYPVNFKLGQNNWEIQSMHGCLFLQFKNCY